MTKADHHSGPIAIPQEERLEEIATRRIVRLAWALVILAVALLVFTAAGYKGSQPFIEHEALTE